MNGNAKQVARLSLFAAISVVFLLLASVVPTGRFVLLAVASFPVCASFMMYGGAWAFAVFIVSAILGGLIAPGSTALLYALFFGYYPVLKSFLEKIHSTKIMWILKFMSYTVVFILYVALARLLLVGEIRTPFSWPVLYIIGAVVFYVYDWCYSVLIRFYIEKIARYFS